MSTLKISQHSDVPAALDLVREEVEKESKRIFSAGGDALKAGKIKPAKEAIAYAEKLAEFVKKIHKLGEDWKKLEAKIDAAAPEVREIVNPKPQKPHKTGFTRNVTHISPKTNFTVRMPDGKTISNSKALWVMAKTIEAIGADRVAGLGIMCGGEPLVTKDKSLLKTHSGTAAKIGYVKKIAKALKVKLVVSNV